MKNSMRRTINIADWWYSLTEAERISFLANSRAVAEIACEPHGVRRIWWRIKKIFRIKRFDV